MSAQTHKSFDLDGLLRETLRAELEGTHDPSLAWEALRAHIQSLQRLTSPSPPDDHELQRCRGQDT